MNVCPFVTVSYFPCWSFAQNWLFCLKFESSVSRKDTVLAIKGLDVQSEALPIIHIHLREVRKHSRGNGYLSLWHSITFLGWSGFPKLIILLETWEYFWLKKHCVDHEVIENALRSSSNHSCTFKGGLKTLTKQWMSVLVTLSHIFPGWSSSKTSVLICAWNWSVYFVEMTMCWHVGIRYAVRCSSNHSYTYKGGWEILKQQWMSVLTAQG